MPRNENNERVLAKCADEVLPTFVDLIEKAFFEKSKNGNVSASTANKLKVYFLHNIRGIQAVVSIRSSYALHAILYILRDVKCSTFFKKLSKHDIDGLRTLMDKVKEYPVPDPDATDAHASKPVVEGTNMELTQRIARVHVDVYIIWEDVTQALDKWNRLLAQFCENKSEKAQVADEELWSFDRLEQEFSKYYDGPKEDSEIQKRRSVQQAKCRRLKNCSDEEKDEVESWFVRTINPETGKSEKMFRAEFAEDLKKFLEISDVVETSVQGVQSGEKSALSQSQPSASVATVEPKPIQVDGMSGLEGLKALIDGWQKMLEAAADKEAKNAKNVKAVMAKANEDGIDPVKLGELLSQATEVNKASIAAAEENAFPEHAGSGRLFSIFCSARYCSSSCMASVPRSVLISGNIPSRH